MIPEMDRRHTVRIGGTPNALDIARRIVTRGAVQQPETDSVRVGSETREQWIDIGLLAVEPSYQRTLKPAWVDHIARHFDESLFGKPVVAERADGSFRVIDGQHRIAALRQLYPEKTVQVLCDVISVSGVEAEAKQFRARNIEIVRPTPGERFKARLAEGDPMAWTIREIVERNGFRLLLYSTGHPPEDALCHVTTLESIAIPREHGDRGRLARVPGASPWLLDQTLRIVQRSWASTKDLNMITLLGIARFMSEFARHPTFSEERLVEVLSRINPKKIERDTYFSASVSKASQMTTAARIIRDLYNKRLKPENQLPEVSDGRGERR